MESLIVDIVPDIYTWVGAYVTDVLSYVAAGILISFVLWTIAYAIDAGFGLVREADIRR